MYGNVQYLSIGRIKEAQQRRVLDDSTRRRRQRKALEALEEDNFQEDPHADLKMNKRAPKFEETVDTCMYQPKTLDNDISNYCAADAKA